MLALVKALKSVTNRSVKGWDKILKGLKEYVEKEQRL